MGRKPRDTAHDEALRRIAQINENADFQEAFAQFAERWRSRGNPSLIEERNVDWDEARRRVIYYGLYYDLRELCDSFQLIWPGDAGYLMRLLYAIDQGSDVADALAPDDCPPQRNWRWFRMARRAMGLPRAAELDALKQQRGDFRASQSRHGLTFEDIAELESDTLGLSDRTVRESVKKCWLYLERGGVNLNRIAEMAGLDTLETLALMFHPRLNRVKPEK
jgi:hypothetical protein